MKYLKLIVIFSFTFLLLFYNGCFGSAAFGTKSEIVDKQAVLNTKYIDILPIIIKTENEKFNIPEADSINNFLKSELKNRNLFQIMNQDELNDDLRAKFLDQGAFLLSEITYFTASFGELNAKVTLKLVNPTSQKVILYSLHDTYTGNSYYLPASIEEITKDAIVGAVNGFQNKLLQ